MGSRHEHHRTHHHEHPHPQSQDHPRRCGCHRLGGALRLVAIGLAVAAVVKELRTPADERTWNGSLAGLVPYDFRPPTLQRLRERLWDPQGGLVGPHVFGVGWTLNVGRAVELVKDARAH